MNDGARPSCRAESRWLGDQITLNPGDEAGVSAGMFVGMDIETSSISKADNQLTIRQLCWNDLVGYRWNILAKSVNPNDQEREHRHPTASDIETSRVGQHLSG
jgi:hypothetical protein